MIGLSLVDLSRIFRRNMRSNIAYQIFHYSLCETFAHCVVEVLDVVVEDGTIAEVVAASTSNHTALV